MAYLDDRIWCHPKITMLSDKAFRTWVNANAYSSGFGLRGRLELEHQRLLGATPKIRKELMQKGVWDELPTGAVAIHDWDEYNGKRDDRRKADRDRKRAARSASLSEGRSAGQSNGTSAGQSAGRSTLAARVDGSEGSDGSEGTPETSTSTSTSSSSSSVLQDPANDDLPLGPPIADLIDRSLATTGTRKGQE